MREVSISQLWGRTWDLFKVNWPLFRVLLVLLPIIIVILICIIVILIFHLIPIDVILALIVLACVYPPNASSCAGGLFGGPPGAAVFRRGL